MQNLRRLILIFALLVCITSVVLLLNFTAPNPTGRRYSSEPVLATGSAQAVGLSGETILSRDLGVPRNDDPDQRQCVCSGSNNSNAIPGDCRSCVAFSSLVSSYRRPDFITAGYIAEAKNRQNLLYEHTDQIDQISEYADAARVLNRPLWLFTRVDTTLSPEYYPIVEATGGSVVPYFTVPGYIDPVDTIARVALVTASFSIVIVLAIGRIRHLPRRSVPPKTPIASAVKTTKSAEDFWSSTKDRLRSQNDAEDARDDFRE